MTIAQILANPLSLALTLWVVGCIVGALVIVARE